MQALIIPKEMLPPTSKHTGRKRADISPMTETYSRKIRTERPPSAQKRSKENIPLKTTNNRFSCRSKNRALHFLPQWKRPAACTAGLCGTPKNGGRALSGAIPESPQLKGSCCFTAQRSRRFYSSSRKKKKKRKMKLPDLTIGSKWRQRISSFSGSEFK